MLLGRHFLTVDDAVSANEEARLKGTVVIKNGELAGRLHIIAEDGEADKEDKVGQVMHVLLG
jgi:uncharacterized protein YifN (PemK superfamily)